MRLVIVEFSSDGLNWSQMGEWPADRSDELWRELGGWVDRNAVSGFLRRRPMTDRDALLREPYPRLSQAEREEVIRRANDSDGED